MRKTVNLILAVIFIAAVSFFMLARFASREAEAYSVEVTQDAYLGGTGEAKLTLAPMNALTWTGWILVQTRSSIAFDLDFVFGSGTATAITMRCETSRDPTTVNDAGRDVHAVTVACGGAPTTCTTTSGTNTWINDVAGNESWTWTVIDIPAPYINCAFIGIAAGADDTLSAYVRGINP